MAISLNTVNNTVSNHETRIRSLESKIGSGAVQGVRWSSNYKIQQGENNNGQVWEKASGYVVTAVTYGEGPNLCTSQNRILQVNIGGTWTNIGYTPTGGYYPPVVSEVSYNDYLA